ncbi:MAG: hypothetical protein JXQ73_10520 [Phycisphaerae bacterium]|nr:hypothetical protein [Phycisphaerae bacterium]
MTTMSDVARLAQLVRSTADLILSSARAADKADSRSALTPPTARTVTTELGQAFQSLARAAQALGLDERPKR